MTQCEGFPIFCFFEFFMPVSKCGQNDGLDHSQLVVESWRPFDVSLIKQILMYLEMIFGKNKEKTTRLLRFKFDTLPAESAGICPFHVRWIKTFYTQPFGQLCIKYVLVFQKIDLVQFCNKYIIGPSQKNSFWALDKWKIDFSCKGNKNSLCQYCCQIQDVNLCKI